jgi:hypothetical protein
MLTPETYNHQFTIDRPNPGDSVKGSGRGGQHHQQPPALGEEGDFAVHASVYGKVQAEGNVTPNNQERKGRRRSLFLPGLGSQATYVDYVPYVSLSRLGGGIHPTTIVLLLISWPLTAPEASECEGNKYKGSANGDYSGEEERNRRGRRAAEKGDHTCSTQAGATHVCIEAELKLPEAQSPTAVSVEAFRFTWDDAQPTLLDSRLDVSQEYLQRLSNVRSHPTIHRQATTLHRIHVLYGQRLKKCSETGADNDEE